MRSDVYEWFYPELARLVKKHRYDYQQIDYKVMVIDSGLGIPCIREMLNDLLQEHHYELVGLLAELMTRDDRVSYQKTGRTYQRKVAKAPPSPEPLLRMLDRAKAGLSCYRGKVVIDNPWTQDTETSILRIFATSVEDAIAKVRAHGLASVPGARVIEANARQIVTQEDEMDAAKADVRLITLRREVNPPIEKSVNSFAAATAILREWHGEAQLSDATVDIAIRIEWENGENWASCYSLSASSWWRSLDVQGMLKNSIAFVLDGVLMPDRTPQENADKLALFREKGAVVHMTRLRNGCMVRDR